jgi:hypothetical protein
MVSQIRRTPYPLSRMRISNLRNLRLSRTLVREAHRDDGGRHDLLACAWRGATEGPSVVVDPCQHLRRRAAHREAAAVLGAPPRYAGPPLPPRATWPARSLVRLPPVVLRWLPAGNCVAS